MDKIKLNLERYKTKNKKLCQTEWQEYAKQTCEDFGVIKPYDKIVFKLAKKNLQFLKAKVGNLKESAEYKGEDIKNYGRLLIYVITQK
jgi:hypothetical protein